MKKKDFMKEVTGLDKAGLEKKAVQLAEELMRLRFKHASRQLEKPHQIGQTRKALARVSTLLSRMSNNVKSGAAQ
jgi:ribosomal protein L29